MPTEKMKKVTIADTQNWSNFLSQIRNFDPDFTLKKTKVQRFSGFAEIRPIVRRI